MKVGDTVILKGRCVRGEIIGVVPRLSRATHRELVFYRVRWYEDCQDGGPRHMVVGEYLEDQIELENKENENAKVSQTSAVSV